MKLKLATLFTLFVLLQNAGAQDNWAPVPCYSSSFAVTKMFVDSLHNELILSFRNDHHICNADFKSVLAYNGTSFHDLDFGLDKHNSNLVTNGDIAINSVPFNGKTLYGGMFASVGSNTLFSEAMATWNGAVWDTFPKFTFTHNPARSGYFPVVNGFLKDAGKLWIYGSFQNLGGVAGNNIYTYNGNSFTAVNIPVSYFGNDYPVFKMAKYKNNIYALGGFTDPPSYSISRLAKYDGSNWTSVGNGIVGSIDNAAELVIYNDTLYIAGTFSKGSGNAGNYIMKWDGSQLSDAGFGNFTSWYAIWKLIVFRNRLYAFGNFPKVGDQKAFGVAYYENGVWKAGTDSVNGTITGAAVYNDELYISGGFSIIGNQTIRNLARLRCPDFDMVSGCISGVAEQPAGLIALKIYPNPANDRLIIEVDPGAGPFTLSLSNVIGELVRPKVEGLEKHELNISTLSKGIYFLTAESAKGRSTMKVIKE